VGGERERKKYGKKKIGGVKIWKLKTPFLPPFLPQKCLDEWDEAKKKEEVKRKSETGAGQEVLQKIAVNTQLGIDDIYL